MRRTWIVALAVLAVAATAAVAQVSVQVDKAYDFAKVRTFAIQLASSWGNPLAEKVVLGEIEKALAGKGWTKADAETCDAMVMVHGATEMRRRLNAMYSGGGWRWGGSGTVQEEEYKVGSLLVDIYDAKTKELLYRGVAQGELTNNADKNQKKVAKAVVKMFKDFPPVPKAN